MSKIPRDPRPMVHTRMPREIIKRTDHLAVEWDTDRARAWQRIFEFALPLLEAEIQK